MITTLHNFTYAKPATEMEPATLSHLLSLCLFSLVPKEIFHNSLHFGDMISKYSQSIFFHYESYKKLYPVYKFLKIFSANRQGEVAYFSNILKLQNEYIQVKKNEKKFYLFRIVFYNNISDESLLMPWQCHKIGASKNILSGYYSISIFGLIGNGNVDSISFEIKWDP